MNICIVAGHTTTGKGTGAVGYINESTENRILAKKVTEYIKKAGHNCDYYAVNKSDTYLKDQTNFANKKAYDVVVQIHFNANKTTSSPIGTETLYKSSKGKVIAERVTKKLGELYKQRGVKLRNDLHWLNATKYPAILIETCFVDSKADTDKYTNNKGATAKLIAEGIIGKDIIETNVTTSSKNDDILWAVCVGAYKDKNKADSIVEELKKKGYTSTYLIPR